MIKNTKANKELFIKMIALWELVDIKEQKVEESGISLIDFMDDYFLLLGHVMTIGFGKEAKDLIDWYMYEDVEKVIYQTKPKKKKYVVDTPLKLWNYIMKHHNE